MAKIAKEVAVQEFTDWMDYKRVKPPFREEHKETIESLVSEIQQGNLTIDEKTKMITYTFPDPVENSSGEVVLTEVKIPARIKTRVRNEYFKGVSPKDADGRLLALVKGITDQPVGVIGNLYTEDYAILQNLALFFL